VEPLFNFERLEVWQRAIVYVEDLNTLADQLDHRDSRALADQLRRAALSIPTNIAEGSGRNSRKEFLYFLNIAKGSVYEVVSLLEIVRRRAYVSEKSHAELYERSVQLSKMLSGLMNSLSTRPKPSTTH